MDRQSTVLDPTVSRAQLAALLLVCLLPATLMWKFLLLSRRRRSAPTPQVDTMLTTRPTLLSGQKECVGLISMLCYRQCGVLVTPMVGTKVILVSPIAEPAYGLTSRSNARVVYTFVAVSWVPMAIELVLEMTAQVLLVATDRVELMRLAMLRPLLRAKATG